MAAEGPPLDERESVEAAHPYLHEDDWRQVEFVRVVDIPYLNYAFEEQHHFRIRHQHEKCGYSQIYLRHEHPNPVAQLQIPVAELTALAGDSAVVQQLYMGPASAAFLVRGGHAVQLPKIGLLYFTEAAGLVQHIGLRPQTFDLGPSDEILSAIHGFATKYSLALIDWYKLEGFHLQDIDSLVYWLGYEVPRKEGGQG